LGQFPRGLNNFVPQLVARALNGFKGKPFGFFLKLI
jgi:hypothetical protein